MTQEAVLKILSKTEWMTTREVSEKVRNNLSSAGRNLKSLHKAGLIEKITRRVECHNKFLWRKKI